MNNKDAQMIELLRKQIEVEEKALLTISKAEEEAKETAVKLILVQMRLDTWKHQELLKGMIEMLTDTPCDEWSAKISRYTGRVRLERHFEKLQQQEKMMGDITSEILKLTKDPLARHLLIHLRNEETMHERDLKEIISLVKQTPLQSKKAEKATDIICETE